jgi:hypothetical protein
MKIGCDNTYLIVIHWTKYYRFQLPNAYKFLCSYNHNSISNKSIMTLQRSTISLSAIAQVSRTTFFTDFAAPARSWLGTHPTDLACLSLIC